MKSKVLITKDALAREYLPVYGNQYWQGKTPNMDELAEKGTVFTKFYTAAPSSAMSYLSMFTEKYPYELEMETYRPVNSQYDGVTLFDKAYDMGYDCHIIWDEAWIIMAKRFSECYGKHTVFHDMKGLQQAVGSHYKHEGILQRNEKLIETTLERIDAQIKEITKSDKPVFLWIHLPHVLNGEIGYGSDIDSFDKCIGIIRNYFDDNEIFISADHGNMNGRKGKLCYGFDVYNPAVLIPLITPRKQNCRKYEKNVSNVDMFKILFSDSFPAEREYIYSDSAYYVQQHRKLAIIKGKYKYIYNNKNKTEELYDMEYDIGEEFSLMSDTFYDVDRKMTSIAREEYFYPYWDVLSKIRDDFRNERIRIWRKPSFRQKTLNGCKDFLRPIYTTIKKIFS